MFMSIDSIFFVLKILGILLSPVVFFLFLRGVRKLFDGGLLRLQHRRYASADWVLLRMVVPKEDPKEPTKGPLVAEQILSALYGVYKKLSLFQFFRGTAQDKFSFEIANIGNEIYFYVHTLKKYQKMVEGQIYAHYPEVEISEVEDYVKSEIEISHLATTSPAGRQSTVVSGEESLVDYESSSDRGFQKVNALGRAYVAELKLSTSHLWPVKTYDYFVNKDDKTLIDTLSGLTSAMSKLNNKADQAWYQVVIRPRSAKWAKYSRVFFDSLRAGYFQKPSWLMEWVSSLYVVPSSFFHWFLLRPFMFFFRILWRVLGQLNPIEKTFGSDERSEVGFSFWEVPKRKFSQHGFQVDIRCAYVSDGQEEASRLKLQEMVSSFHQFTWGETNGFKLATMGTSTSLRERFKTRSCSQRMLLSTEEIATVFHLPMHTLETPNIVWVRSKKLEPPPNLPRPGKVEGLTILGKTNYRGDSEEFGIKMSDRARHVYIIGKTGMGKSTLLENMLYSDIMQGRGVAIVDPHGETADTVLRCVPKERVNDVIVFDPSDREFPVSFNMLEVKNPEHRSLVASGLVGVFKKMYADSWGPRLEHILRNTILALTEYPGATLLGIPRMLVDPVFRGKVVEKITDPVCGAFWKDEFANMTDKFRTEAIAPIQNKVGQFLSSPLVRNILGQPKSSIDIRKAMDEKKILIVNLSKGKIGEDNSSLLGSMLITKFQLDAMSRADIEPKDRVPFYLYVDEFQNFATDAFATILSEARKYKLNLTMANQYVAQMEEEVMGAVFGNVGTLITFQTGFDDAEMFSNQFAEQVSANDVISLSKYTVYMRLLVDNMPTQTFSAVMSPPVNIDTSETTQAVIDASRREYSASRDDVEKQISQWSSGTLVAPEEGKAIKALQQASGGAGVRWRYDRYEFEDLVKSAGHKMRLLNREEYEKYRVKKAVNELVYFVPAKGWIIYSRIDNAGKCFNKKDDNGIVVEEWGEGSSVIPPSERAGSHQSSVDTVAGAAELNSGNKFIGAVDKAPGWQLGLNKILGGGFRSSQNRGEMEKVFERLKVDYDELPRERFEDFKLPKSVNELVMILNDEYLVLTALDPQGGCFTRNPDQMIQIGVVRDGKFSLEGKVKKSIDWEDDLECEILRVVRGEHR
jgi:hypothetical protein